MKFFRVIRSLTVEPVLDALAMRRLAPGKASLVYWWAVAFEYRALVATMALFTPRTAWPPTDEPNPNPPEEHGL